MKLAELKALAGGALAAKQPDATTYMRRRTARLLADQLRDPKRISALVQAAEALAAIHKSDPAPSQMEQWIQWTHEQTSAALSALREAGLEP